MRHDKGGRRDFKPRNFAPVKVGDELSVKIEAVGEKGDGIAKKDGFVLFVPNTKQGDEVRIRVTRVLQKVAFAELAGEKSSQDMEKSGEEAPEQETETQEQTEGSGEEDFQGEDSDNFGEEDS